jgi:16S rRNA processing protein RimM
MSDNPKRASSASRGRGTPKSGGGDFYTHRNRRVYVPKGYMAVGYIIGVHGLRGELKVESHTDIPERFAAGSQLWMMGETLEKVTIAQARPHQSHWLVQFEEIAGRDAAEEVRGLWLFIPDDEAASLPEDTYFVHDIIGLQVYSTDEQLLGTVRDVLFTAANEVYIVAPAPGVNKDRELLIPAIAEVVQHVDLVKKTMTVQLLPGLLEE